MTLLTWDDTGKRRYETGVDHGVLYMPDVNGNYDDGVAWNGLVTVTETPSGAEATATWADNIKYLNLISAEEFAATVEAYTYPDEFQQYDGLAVPTPGVVVGQQARKVFGMSYRTRVGNDIQGDALGYKLHLLYGCQASPSEKAYSTVNDSPEAITFSWDVSTTPIPVSGLRPSSLLVIDSTEVDPTKLATLEGLLYGAGGNPQLPLPDAVISTFTTGVTLVDMGVAANQPTYDSGTHVVTLPAVTGVKWYINGVLKTSGAQPAMTSGQVSHVEAQATSAAYALIGDTDWTYDY